MRWRAVALASLGVNILAAVWMLSNKQPATSKAPTNPPASSELGAASKTNVVVRRQWFTWHELESPDYPTYINNLREIGCPEQTIRDIIIADVNALFARRRATELVTPEQQWWRTEPDTNVLYAAFEKARSLEEERQTLLTKLLGDDWESGDMISMPRPSRPGIVLDGPLLGDLSPETKQELQEINVRSEDRLQEYLRSAAREGRSPDPAEIAKFRQQIRQELAGVLAPAQLEEYLLRYSQNGSQLRADLGALKYFNPSPEEFRNLFRATDQLDNQIQLLSGDEAHVVEQRRALEQARENAIRVALGPRRYEEYRLLQDPMYQEAVAAAQAAGTPDAARTLYQVNLAAAAEQASIGTDTNLTAMQREVALKQLELEKLTANTFASGQEPVPPRPPTPQNVPRRTYSVHPGDNLAVIALIYGVPEGLIRQLNPQVNFNRLFPGQTLLLPQRVFMAPMGAP